MLCTNFTEEVSSFYTSPAHKLMTSAFRVQIFFTSNFCLRETDFTSGSSQIIVVNNNANDMHIVFN